MAGWSVQSAHWCKNQVTQMLGFYWHSKECWSAVVIFDDNYYNKDLIVVFLEHLIKSLVSSDIARLQTWSDSPSSQFKNGDIAAVMSELESTFCTKIMWNFFATSHRKGPIGAIRGIVKHQVSTRVMQHWAILQNAESFYKCALEYCTGVNNYYISSRRNSRYSYQLPICFWEYSGFAWYFSTMHEFPVNCQSIQMRTYGYESTLTICPRQAEIEKKGINVRMFVISKYDYAVKNVWSENDKSKTKQLLAVIKDADHNQFTVIYGKTISKQLFKIVEMIIMLLPEMKSFQPIAFPNLRIYIYIWIWPKHWCCKIKAF